jgi:hypothetical protein
MTGLQVVGVLQVGLQGVGEGALDFEPLEALLILFLLHTLEGEALLALLIYLCHDQSF